MLAGCESRVFQPAFMPSGYAHHGGEYNVPPERNIQHDLLRLDTEREAKKDYSDRMNVPKGYGQPTKSVHAPMVGANMSAFDYTDGYTEYNK